MAKQQLEQSEKRGGEYASVGSKVWRVARPVVIVLVSLALAAGAVYYGFNFVMTHFLLPVDGADTSNIVFEVPRGSSTSAIASLLYDYGLIRNKAVFKIYVDFMGKGNKLRSGTYVMNRTMEIEQIVDQLAAGDGTKQEVIKFRLTEGMTVEDMADALVRQGVLKDSKHFLELAKSGEEFEKYDFVDQIPIDPENKRRYLLEGYLFPDTYEEYVGASEESVINRLLLRFFDIFTDEDIARAQELGLSIDEVVTLASMIEKEAKTEDFAKVSAVFHNRLAEEMKLESDVTVHYVKGINKLSLSNEDTSVDSRYNTYKYAGLPLGPICNPGRAAMRAALYPDEEMLEDGYLFFCLQDPLSGKLSFTKTLEEHRAEVDKYRDSWIEYDKEHNQ